MNNEKQLWTGARMLAEPDSSRRNFGLVAASSAVDASGLVRIDLPARLVRGCDDGIMILLTEDQGRELAAVLTRTLHGIAELRALHHLCLLKEEAYTSTSVADEGGSTTE